MRVARKRNDGGFSLTEVITALFLLTVGLMATTSTLVAVFKSRDYSKSLMAVTNLAQKSMEEVKSMDYGEIDSVTDSYGEVSGYEQCRRIVTVTPNADNTLKTVVIEVFSNKGQTIKLTTLVSRR